MSDTGTIHWGDAAASSGGQDHPPTEDSAHERARRIVEEVLAAHERRDRRGDAPEADEGTDDGDEHVIDLTEPTPTEPAPDEVTDEPTDEPTPAEPARVASQDALGGYDRTASPIVLLSLESPVVLLPDQAYEPAPSAWQPEETTRLGTLADRALLPITDGPSASVREALQRATYSPETPGVRWALAAVVWLIAAALLAPAFASGLGAALDLELDIWSDGAQPVQQQAEDPTGDEPADAPTVSLDR